MKSMSIFIIIISVYACSRNKILNSINDKQLSQLSNVVNFGAKPNDNVDDTEAILNAYNDARTNTGILHFPAGKFILKKSIVTKIVDGLGAIKIEGAGMNSSILSYEGAETEAVLNLDGGFFKVSDIFISGGRTAKYGILNNNMTYNTISNVRIMLCKNAAISMGAGWCNAFRDCLFQECNNGVEQNAGACNANTFDHCTFLDLRGIGFVQNRGGSYAQTFSNCVFEKNDNMAMFINASSNIEVRNCYFEDVAKYSLFSEQFKAMVLINGTSSVIDLGCAYPSNNINITNCFVSNYSANFFVFGVSAVGLRLQNNTLINMTPKQSTSLFGMLNDYSKTGIENLQIMDNTGFQSNIKLVKSTTASIENIDGLAKYYNSTQKANTFSNTSNRSSTQKEIQLLKNKDVLIQNFSLESAEFDRLISISIYAKDKRDKLSGEVLLGNNKKRVAYFDTDKNYIQFICQKDRLGNTPIYLKGNADGYILLSDLEIYEIK